MTEEQTFSQLIEQFEKTSGITYLQKTKITLIKAFQIATQQTHETPIIIFLNQIHNYPQREQQIFTKLFCKATQQKWTPNIQEAVIGPKTGYHLFIATYMRLGNKQWKNMNIQQKNLWNQTANNQ